MKYKNKRSLFKRLKKHLYFQFLKIFSNEIYVYGHKDSMFQSIKTMKRRGFTPKTIIDVGAYTGGWTTSVIKYFPEAKFIMCEAQPTKKPFLEKIKQKFPSQVEYHMGLLGAKEKDNMPYYLMETGSSVFEENSGYDREKVQLPMRTLDTLIDVNSLEAPFLLKLDVQGYEIEVLKGARTLLAKADIILLEVSILEYNKGAPLIAEVIDFMNTHGFSMFDITELKRTSGNHALFQADAFFCKHEHSFINTKTFDIK